MLDRVAEPPADSLAALLKRTFGHEGFRPMQREIVETAMAGGDSVVIMPTGGGKSLCYQLPAVAGTGVTLVVSPLIALMHDQVQALHTHGVEATYLNSSVPAPEVAQRERDAAGGRYRLVYLAPERLMAGVGMRLIEKLVEGPGLSLVAVDEAHCISEWGHDFRPEYRMLGTLRQRGIEAPVMALTATATLRVADDIARQLHLRSPRTFRGDFERKNLYYEVRPKKRMLEAILKYLKQSPHHDGIIYCLSRRKTEEMAQALQGYGIAALPYHAGMTSQDRTKNQHAFVYGDARVITATIAFGMGIDKPDVRFVIHSDLPRNLEGYYQETGRAGRDGLPADCILFFSEGDRVMLERFIEEKPDEAERRRAYEQLQRVIDYAHSWHCRCKSLLGYFGERLDGPCGHCDNCGRPAVMEDATQSARKLLSAVARTGQRFGIRHIAAVLQGERTEAIERYGHDRLSVFGIGAAHGLLHWRQVALHLVQEGLLGQTHDEYRTLHLTAQSVPLMRGERTFSMPQEVSHRGRGKAAREQQAPGMAREAPEATVSTADEALFEALRELRKAVAQVEGVAPYMVFSNVTLRELARVRPGDREALLAVRGVGEHKAERYGETFLEAIANHRGGEA